MPSGSHARGEEMRVQAMGVMGLRLPAAVIATVALLALAALAQGTADRSERAYRSKSKPRGKAQPPPYAEDTRFDRPFTHSSDRARLDAVVAALATATTARLEVEGQYRSRRVFLDVKERPARELMDVLASLTGASWVKEGKVYVLVSHPDLAPYAALSDEERSRQGVLAYRKVLNSLSSGQRRFLERGGEISYRNATPKQRRLLRELGRQAYVSFFNREGAGNSHWLQGQGLGIQLKSINTNGKITAFQPVNPGGTTEVHLGFFDGFGAQVSRYAQPLSR